MIIKILSFTGANDVFFNVSIKIRFTVFTQELNVDKNIEYDGLDFDATHFLVFIDDQPAATIRYRETENGIVLERLSVLKQFRSFGIANLLVRHVLYDLKHAKQSLFLISPISLLDFFKNIGFIIERNDFINNADKFFKMIYNK
ncbi:MAG: GNAT family N-acetyltransferase [Bacteroidales bacterium]|nr:GNAT family N-acetyltransferase [Bacteroidales bacterium]